MIFICFLIITHFYSRHINVCKYFTLIQTNMYKCEIESGNISVAFCWYYINETVCLCFVLYFKGEKRSWNAEFPSCLHHLYVGWWTRSLTAFHRDAATCRCHVPLPAPVVSLVAFSLTFLMSRSSVSLNLPVSFSRFFICFAASLLLMSWKCFQFNSIQFNSVYL